MRVVISGSHRDLDRGSRKFNYKKQEKAERHKLFNEKQKKKQERKEVKQAKISGKPLPVVQKKSKIYKELEEEAGRDVYNKPAKDAEVSNKNN